MHAGVDYIGVSAGAVIVNDKGQYFLAKRSAGARDDQGMWEFPGGTINMHETRENAAIRNIKRKYDFEIAIDGTLDVYDVVDKKSGDHWVSTTFRCHYVSGEPKIMDPKKCDQIGWFTLGQIEKLPLSRITKLNFIDVTEQVR